MTQIDDSTFRQFALETARDNDVDYATGVRMLVDEPGEVSRAIGCDDDAVREWVRAEEDRLSETAVRRLRAEATEAGDLTQVALCDRALDGDDTARLDCARVIAARGAGGAGAGRAEAGRPLRREMSIF